MPETHVTDVIAQIDARPLVPLQIRTLILCGVAALPDGAGSFGLIAVTAIFYPTAMRSTGVGWAMGIGRFNSFIGPLLVGLMVGAGWNITTTYGAVGTPALVAAVCTVMLGWRHGRNCASRAAPAATH
jgi:MFS transporter, AAHS family, 4-hydroxybenzoate transporter